MTQSMDIHDVLNAQGFEMNCRAISHRGSHFEVSEREVFFSVLRILKHGDPVGDQRFMSLFYYTYLNKLSFIHKHCYFSFET